MLTQFIIAVCMFILAVTVAPPAQAAIWYDKLPPSGQRAPESFGDQPAEVEDEINLLPDQQSRPITDVAASPVPASESIPAQSISAGNTWIRWVVITIFLIILAVVAVWSWRRRQP